MSYGADFATADPANAPLDAPILIGADPAVMVAGLLLLLAAFALGWFFAGRSRRNDGDATASIWHAIDKAAKEAMKADDHALRGKADHLAETLRKRLGKTLAFTAGDEGLAHAVAGLTAALNGRKPDETPGHDEPDHGDHHEHVDHHDHHDESHKAHDHVHSAPATASASTGSVTIVNVIPPAAPAPTPHHPPAKPRPHHGPKEMTAREQTEALRLAVAAFNEHWRHEGLRIGQMRAALAELSGSAPGGPRLSHG
ncbi:hypothetical protein GCM10009422_10300 [Brevundimonas kwangchunensis]|uniref:Uncharacterized protein n=1 Tax=Brevundimonas kwangchunensis TaxID=322163 RepID=A0ABN1GR54_9CAUL